MEGDTVNLNDDTFFSSCAFLQSSGRALTLFTKEEMDTQHFDEGWKKDDVITVSRDSTNSISFDINGKTKSIFSNITEDLKVVICVKSSINEGTFEIIEAKN